VTATDTSSDTTPKTGRVASLLERFDLDRARKYEAFAVTLIVAAVLIPLYGLLKAPGPPMEEGFMLVFPERVLHGDIPNKDFLHLYGPGSLWVLAAVYKLFGVTLLTERLFGLAQEMAVVFGVYFIARRWGRVAALSSGLLSLLFILAPHGLTALAWVGGVAFGLFALVSGAASRESTDPRRSHRLAVLAGLLAGFALLYRIDLAIALTLSCLALLWGAHRDVLKRFALGLAAGLSPYIIHIASAGVSNVWHGMITQPIFDLRGGRHLPIPPPWNSLEAVQYVAEFVRIAWPIPHLNSPAQISLWFFLLVGSILTLVVVGATAVRRDRTAMRPRLLLAAALFSLGMFPQALQRADTTHLAWVATVAMALLPIAAIEVWQRRRPGVSPLRVSLVSGASCLVVIGLLIPNVTTRSYLGYAVQDIGIHKQYAGHEMKNRGRVFYNGRADHARAINRMLQDVEHLSKPGDRLFVGTKDLRKTPLSEAFFYYLLPQLTPSTYYIEMDPGVANAPDSGLANEVRHSDILILSSAWAYWDEPNDSRKVGSPKPNRVVKRDFCLFKRYALNKGTAYFLYTKCDNPRR
jgi:hypothetical protein